MWTKDYLVCGLVPGWGQVGLQRAAEWQALYRVEGARRALKASREVAAQERRWADRWQEQRRAHLAAARARRAWEASPEGRALLAERRETQALKEERNLRLRTRARTRSPVWAPGGRNHRVWAAYRAGGRTLKDVGLEFGISGGRVRGIVAEQDEVEEARALLAGQRWRRSLAPVNRGRPIDLDAPHGGGPRDVWLTYGPSPDPRLDNMIPVPVGAGPVAP